MEKDLMAKIIYSVPFDYSNELNKFLNKHMIPKEDIVDIRHHWNMGYDVFVLTFYAEENLKPAINAQQKKFNKNYQQTYLIILGIVGLLFLAGLAYGLLKP